MYTESEWQELIDEQRAQKALDDAESADKEGELFVC